MSHYIPLIVIAALVGGVAGANVHDFGSSKPDPVDAYFEMARAQGDADGGRIFCLKDDAAERYKVSNAIVGHGIALPGLAEKAGLARETVQQIVDAYFDRFNAQSVGPCDPAKVESNEARALELKRSLSAASSAG